MRYDDATWHSEGDFPKDLPSEAGGTHIGMFLAWAFSAGFVGELHIKESAEDLIKLNERKITGRDFLFINCDGKLTDDDFNEEGNAFASEYLEEDYIDDYASIVPNELETVYHLEDSWQNFEKLKVILDARLELWRKSK